MTTTAFLNAQIVDGRVVLLYRDDAGTLKKKSVPAEFVSYHPKVLHEDPERNDRMVRALKKDRRVLGVTPEGDYWRVRWKGKWERREACKAMRAHEVPVFEGDVNPIRRLISDLGLGIAKQRRLYFDLEVDSQKTFAKQRAGEARILSWCARDEEGNRYIAILEAWTDEAERRLIEQFWELARRYDQLLAWSGRFGSDTYDFVVLEQRSKRLGAHPGEIWRWNWLDHHDVFERMNKNASESGEEKQSLKLQDVGMVMLGRGKDDFDSSKTYEGWLAAFNAGQTFGYVLHLKATRGLMSTIVQIACVAMLCPLLRYNVNDVDLMLDIEHKTGYVALFGSLCEACGLFPNTYSLYPTVQMDGFLLRLGVERNYHFPTKWYDKEEPDFQHEKFEGAYVLHPTVTGVVENVRVADFASMYPSIIITWNMSLETLIGIRAPDDVPVNACRAPGTGACFRNDRQGILAYAVQELLRLRDYWRKLKATFPPGSPEAIDAERRSNAYKVAANAFFGASGNRFCRFYNELLAESITTTGAWLNKSTMAIGRDAPWHIDPIYGDSVTSDRTIVVRWADGRIDTVPIGELWESSFMRRTKGEGSHQKEIGDLPCVEALTELGWRRISRIVRHKTSKSTYRLTSKHGQVEVTEDHGIMCDGEPTAPRDFAQGEIFTKVALPPTSVLKRIDLWPYVSSYRNVHGRSDRRFTCDDKWIYFPSNLGKSVKVKRIYEAGSPEFRALLRLIAAYTSDGSASIAGKTCHRYVLSFCKAKLAHMRQVARDLRTICRGCKISGPFWTETVYVVRSGTACMAAFFDAICGSKCVGKRLPSFVYQLDREDFEVLRDGIARGDGHIDPAGQLDYTSKSQRLIAGISLLFSQHGIPHSFKFRPEKEAWSFRTRKGRERPSRYSILTERHGPALGYVYDLEVEEAHTFVDGVGQVLLHNTDASMVVGVTRERFDEFVEWCNAEFYPRIIGETGAKMIDGFGRVKLEHEKGYKRIVFIKKNDGKAASKRYIGVYDYYKGKAADQSSKPEIKGIEWKRGDSLAMLRRMQWDIVEAFWKGDWQTLEPFTAIVERWRHHVLDEALTIDEIKIAQSITKPIDDYVVKKKKDGTDSAAPAHVRIGKLLLDRGQEIGEGTRVEYYMHEHATRDVRPAVDFDGTCDRHFIWDQKLYPACQRLFEAIRPEHDWAQYRRSRPQVPRQQRRKAPTIDLSKVLLDDFVPPPRRRRKTSVDLPDQDPHNGFETMGESDPGDQSRPG